MAMSDVIIKTKDIEYEKVKNNFLRELQQFQKSRGLGVQKIPKINGRDVDLYLLYQIVTSHGGWEKVNSRNEWVELLEHFNLPKSSNGGVAFKQIYLKYLELYEKMHFLGEDVDRKEDADDDYEDYRLHRRRLDHSRKATPQTTPAAGSSAMTTPHPGSDPIPESTRLQYGLSLDFANPYYDKLIMTLQSPLPNEQDVAIGVCSLLSNETKHVLQLTKCPRLVDHLLAHAGVFSHCSLRELTEEVYSKGRGYDHTTFWLETLYSKDTQELLCEQFVNKVRKNLGVDLYENDFKRTKNEDLEENIPESSKDYDCIIDDDRLDDEPSTDSSMCCEKCVCHNNSSSILLPQTKYDEENNFSVVSIRKSKRTEQAGQRITQISHIIRNLSFEPGNAEIMARNLTVQRFLLLSLKCGWSNLSQLSWDALGNLAKFMELNEPLLDPLSSMFVSMVIDALLSTDRFHVIRSLEILTGWFSTDSNGVVLLPYFEQKVFRRICQLLGINDIMLLIYTLECILSMTSRGEEVCDQFANIEGSVDTLVSLVTVEAQSYGPKGCISMRVVETVSTIQPVPQAMKQQSPQVASNTYQGTPQPTYQQQGIQRPYQRPATTSIPSSIPSIPQQTSSKPITLSAATTWTPTRVPTPPHIPNLSPSSQSATPQTPSPTPRSQVHLQAATSSNPPVLINTPGYISLPPGAVNFQAGSPSTRMTLPAANTQIPTQSQMPRLLVNSPATDIRTSAPNTVTADGRLTEDGWAMAWLKGAFDIMQGTSIEQGELYRMYCTARRNPQMVLGMDQFIICVKNVYGNGIGPVMKIFGGGSSLSFIEGIRPKLAMRNIPSSNPIPPLMNSSVSHSAPTNVNSVPINQNQGSPVHVQAPVNSSQLPVSVTIPARDAKTGVTSTSPILKATLSRPPKPSNPTGSKKQKQSNCNTKKYRRNSERTSGKTNLNSIVSPTSSAIRSLLASKVAQRQQKKLQEPEDVKQNSKPLKKKGPAPKKKSGENTVNGVLDSIVNRASEECSVSSINSTASSETTPPPLISFQGVLQNGLSSGESSKDGDSEPPCLKEEVADIKQDKLKGMLVDLLERKVGPREQVNGLIGNREIRISDKGLELIKQEGKNKDNAELSETLPTAEDPLNSGSTSTPAVISPASGTPDSSANSVVQPRTDPALSGSGAGDNAQHQMTFYSAGGSQLGIKRPLATNDSSRLDPEQPPLKKPSLNNGNGCCSTPPSLTDSSETSANPNGATNLENQDSLSSASLPANDSSVKQEMEFKEQNHLNTNSSDAIQVSSHLPQVQTTATTSVLTTVNATPTTSVNISLQTSTTATTPTANSLVQFPVTIAMNHVSNQITFPRQYVLPGGQPILLKTPNSQTPLQGQVIISKPPNSSNDQIPKAIIILQQPQSGITQAGNQLGAVASGAQVKLMPSLTPVNSTTEKLPTKTQEQLDLEIPYLCEWAGCGMRFTTHQQVLLHAIAKHCSETVTTPVRCEWGPNGCDPLLRKRYSLMTHLQDRHCAKPALELALYRRKNKIDPPPPPQQPIHHPGYAPNAAFHAIRRHALQFMNPRELLDDNEGPVTKSIRLSASLILRNICMYSSIGRRKLRTYESHLSAIGMSNVESSRTIAHLLHELNHSRRVSNI